MKIIINKEEREFLIRNLSKMNIRNKQLTLNKLNESILVDLDKYETVIIGKLLQIVIKSLEMALATYILRDNAEYIQKTKEKITMIEKLNKKLLIKQGENNG